MAWARRGRVLVAGSLHLDVIVNAPSLPRLDETLMGTDVAYEFGGKGGNQARAAARFGARTALAGRIGSDGFADRIAQVLDRSGIDHTQVLRDDGATGMSVAIVDANGDYGAVVVSAANRRIVAGDIAVPDETALLLLQNEIPAGVNLALARRARAAGVRVLWNAAPARGADPQLLHLTDLLIVNRIEAADMTGLHTPPEQVEALAAMTRGPVLITLGADGVLCADGPVTHHPAKQVQVISTHGAGDAFTGALAARLADGADLPDAIAFAQAAAALHVSTPVGDRDRITPQQVLARL